MWDLWQDAHDVNITAGQCNFISSAPEEFQAEFCPLMTERIPSHPLQQRFDEVLCGLLKSNGVLEQNEVSHRGSIVARDIGLHLRLLHPLHRHIWLHLRLLHRLNRDCCRCCYCCRFDSKMGCPDLVPICCFRFCCLLLLLLLLLLL